MGKQTLKLPASHAHSFGRLTLRASGCYGVVDLHLSKQGKNESLVLQPGSQLSSHSKMT